VAFSEADLAAVRVRAPPEAAVVDAPRAAAAAFAAVAVVEAPVAEAAAALAAVAAVEAPVAVVEAALAAAAAAAVAVAATVAELAARYSVAAAERRPRDHPARRARGTPAAVRAQRS
jgi:hypothetical protein